jgi:succinate dehydrogenase / fumarate reductase cytochrome b subunit
MTRVFAFLDSTVGKKILMAVTGIVLFGFVVVHMLGNLQVYLGPTKLDEYGVALRKIPALLWAARLVLLGSAVAHAWAAWSVTRASWAARPVGYRTWKPNDAASSYASRTMRWSGVIVLLFIAYHLLHLTLGSVHPDFVEGAVNHNFVVGFQQKGAAAFYILAMACLGLHMWHGVWSLTQTLGLSHPRYNALRRAFATAVTVAVVVGNISFPVAVLAGFLREAPKVAHAGAQAPGAR